MTCHVTSPGSDQECRRATDHRDPTDAAQFHPTVGDRHLAWCGTRGNTIHLAAITTAGAWKDGSEWLTARSMCGALVTAVLTATEWEDRANLCRKCRRHLTCPA